MQDESARIENNEPIANALQKSVEVTVRSIQSAITAHGQDGRYLRTKERASSNVHVIHGRCEFRYTVRPSVCAVYAPCATVHGQHRTVRLGRECNKLRYHERDMAYIVHAIKSFVGKL